MPAILAHGQGSDAGASARVAQALAQSFGSRFTTVRAVCQTHANTLTWLAAEPPDGVVFVRSSEEVQAVVKLCAEHRVPVIPFGAGTSLEGHVNAPRGGISVDLTGMDRILSVSPQDFDCTVEAGVTRETLNAHLRDAGLFFPVDPGANASLGGMAATRASGTAAVRYGTMRDNVVSLTAVMADGRLIRTARRAKKTSAGYDLTRLLVGSEGTLGIITELTLRLHGIPEAIGAGICPFGTVGAACEAAIQTIQAGVPLARVELIDALQARACNLHSKLGLVEQPHLLVEFHGTAAAVAEQAAIFEAIAADNGGGAFAWATQAEERAQLWRARHDAYWAAFALRPGAKALATDVCVPISRLAECVTATQEDMGAAGLTGPILGHVGDGNFHVTLLVDMADVAEVAAVKTFLSRLALRAIEMDGTCTGEHGIGQGKIGYLDAELGEALDVMRAVKRALDPLDILNPGKILVL